MATAAKITHNKFAALEKELAGQREELLARLGERQRSVFIEREPDDEMADAYESLTRDMIITTLERERKTLEEIERALARIRKGEYGTCSMCGTKIPDARLRALPWARNCVNCASGGASSISRNL